MSVGKIREFDVQSGNWSAYVERLEMYFLANGIKDEVKLPTLIAAIGESAYELLSTLASPKKPKDLTYLAAVDLLRKHLQPKPSPMAERYKFRLRRQFEGESINDYIAVLKKMARDCEFGTVLEENLRDQLVCGLRCDVIRQRLFAEEKLLTYEKAVTLACSLEAAERDAALVEKSVTSAGQLSSGGGVHAIHAANLNRPGSARGGGGRGAGRAVTSASHVRDFCGSCGGRDHLANECRFKMYNCSKCGAMGHLRRMCMVDKTVAARSGGNGPRQRNSRRGAFNRLRGGAGGSNVGVYHASNSRDYVRDDEEDCGADILSEEPVMQMSLSQYKPVSMCLQVENRDLIMELDTGSALSCISKQTFDNMFGHLPLLKCNLALSFYDGTKVRPLGYCVTRVSYKQCDKLLDLYVIDNGTTSLLGRQWLTELEIEVPKLFVNTLDVNEGTVCKSVDNLYSSYAELFDGGLGRFTGGRARLHVRPDAVPVFCRARPLPYALRERVDAELDAMLRAGVIEPVDSSEWATPLVIVNKPDGAIRLCADYKVTLNKVLAVDKYPVPKIDDVLAKLDGSKYFSKIDLSQAYNQIELDETRIYTVINTHRGLFMYNRLVFGLSSSPGIFQRIMANLFKDIPGVVTFLDDVLISTESKSSHLLTLEKVLNKLKEFGLKVKKEKCAFFVNKVKYLGYVIDKDGVHADVDKIKPILDMAVPRDVTELRSFIGMLNFYGRFIKNLSAYLHPLYQLLKKDTPWNWGKHQQWAFVEVKRRLGEATALSHYSVGAPLVVTSDASARGLGAVLAQRGADGVERPVMFASRALTAAELNYSQIQKEALAIVFSVKKFHQYLYGRSFTLRTDHKPLVTIFGPHQGIPSMTASRLQRWALILTAYDFEIEYVRSDENVADALSRMISAHKENKLVEEQEYPEQTYLHFASEALLMDYNKLKSETAKDPCLGRVLSYIKDGWPQELEIKELKPYFNRRHELYEELGCVMWGHRVVVPRACVERVLRELHDPHMGINKTKQLARSYVWWAGIDEAVEAVCRACAVCARVQDAPDRHAVRVWPWPDRPWSRLHLDFLGPLKGQIYLVIIDAYSKWIEISRVSSTSAKCVLSKLRELWARFGLPKQIVSDNGPPFTSEEFGKFLKNNGIEHLFSAPYHPSSNGAAENAVKICKRVIKKAYIQGVDIDTALNRYLLMYRNTEHCTTGESPAKLLQGRSLRTRLDCLKPQRGARVHREQQRQGRAHVGTLREFQPGEPVWYRIYRGGDDKWLKGWVESRLGQTDYNIFTDDRTVVHRHADQIKQRIDRERFSEQEQSVRSKPVSKKSYLVYPNDPVPAAAGSELSPGSHGGGDDGGGVGVARGAPGRVGECPCPRSRRPPQYFGFEID